MKGGGVKNLIWRLIIGYIEWIVWGPEQGNFALVKAPDQREAILKAMEKGIRPGRSTDARPRSGDAVLMTRKEFEDFMEL